jgi:hypothetical protein
VDSDGPVGLGGTRLCGRVADDVVPEGVPLKLPRPVVNLDQARGPSAVGTHA